MNIDYNSDKTACIITNFYNEENINLIRPLAEYTNFVGENSDKAFIFLLSHTEEMPPIKFRGFPKAQHSIWVAKCASLFLDSCDCDKDVYLYSALWHDLVEDSLKFKKTKIDNYSIDKEIVILKDKIGNVFEKDFIDVIFGIVKKLTKSDADGYFVYVDQIYSGGSELVDIASFIKNCDMIVNCNTVHVFSYIKQIRQFLKYLKKINIDRNYLSSIFASDFRKQLIYDSNLELARVVCNGIWNCIGKYESDNNVSDEGKKLWKELAVVYGEKYKGYNHVTSAVTQRDIIYNPVKIFDGTISTFKAFLDPYESFDIKKQMESKFQSEGRDYLALIGLYNLAKKFEDNPSFFIKGF